MTLLIQAALQRGQLGLESFVPGPKLTLAEGCCHHLTFEQRVPAEPLALRPLTFSRFVPQPIDLILELGNTGFSRLQ